MFNFLTNSLGNFLNDWWNTIRIFFHEIDPILKALIITFLFLLALLSFVRCFKPMYGADKNKPRTLAITGTIFFTALACLVIFI